MICLTTDLRKRSYISVLLPQQVFLEIERGPSARSLLLACQKHRQEQQPLLLFQLIQKQTNAKSNRQVFLPRQTSLQETKLLSNLPFVILKSRYFCDTRTPLLGPQAQNSPM